MAKVGMEFSTYGSRELKRRGYKIGRHKARRLMRLVVMEAIYPRKRLTYPDKEHEIYPYLLRDVVIDRPNMAYAADITYIRLKHGFVYLVVVRDLFSRYIVSWKISNTMETDFCCEALKDALKTGRPEYFNTDQGAQFTSKKFTSILKNNGIRISMGGKSRVIDNIFIERFWHTLKYEEVYTKAYESIRDCERNIGEFMEKYNARRLHESLGEYDTPLKAYLQTKLAVA